MLVGTSSQTVEVTASNPLVDTTDSSLGEVMNEDEVEGLPLNGRVFSQLIITVPGAVASGFSSAPEAAAGAGASTDHCIGQWPSLGRHHLHARWRQRYGIAECI
jgi:hypothetical protein